MLHRNARSILVMLLMTAVFTHRGTADDISLGGLESWIGEYESFESTDGSKLGLHLTVHPNDQPFGQLFSQGLPVTGWTKSMATSLTGRRGDGYWQLAGGNYKVFVSPATPVSLLGTKSDSESLAIRHQAPFLRSGVRFIRAPASRNIATSTVVAARVQVAHDDGRKWTLQKVHRRGVSLNQPPPANAVVLFSQDGVANQMENAVVLEPGVLGVGAITSFPVRAFEMHLEFRIPAMLEKRGQQRGNSGIYIQRRYEVQILDSFGDAPSIDGCGSLYRQRPPEVNVCLAPGAWQTYDIFFEPATWDSSGRKVQPAQISVIHNGVPIQYRQTIRTKTGAGQVEGPQPLPILFQDHGDAVHFRNVWLLHRECIF